MSYTISDVLNQAKTYLYEDSSFDLINKAYEIALRQHAGQYRKSGEPYIIHPLAVAYILATLNTSPVTIASGLLHDVIEDTGMTKDELANLVGVDVAQIVDGVTKISMLKYKTKEKALASNHQKILLAMAKDIRVVLVKLVDRLHNMQTLAYQSAEKQKVIAKETLDLYAPLAHRLGMYRLKAELEDLSLKYLEPSEYDYIKIELEKKRSSNEADIQKMIDDLTLMLKNGSINSFEIKGRVKNIYSIYNKMVNKNKSMDDIYDYLALRIIVGSVAECYLALGLVHSKYTPIPMRFKDYIAVPKSNLYQSLHTTVVAFDGKIFEIQIRTKEMDEIAENGVAAHWAYKEHKSLSPHDEQIEIANKLKWYKDLEQYVDNHDEDDPLNNIIDDIFNASVYVFTPNGDVIELPKGAMPLDFAYKIHTDLGNKTTGAIVNGKIVPLSYHLKTGDVVSILSSKTSAGPTREWLKHVKTSHARSKIKTYINKMQHDEMVKDGMSQLEIVAKNAKFDLNSVDDEMIKDRINLPNIKTIDDICFEIAKGNVSPLSIINRFMGKTDVRLTEEKLINLYQERENIYHPKSHNNLGIIVEGLDRASIRLGNCCQPIYGDQVVGYVTKGTGIVVHRIGCPNLNNVNTERTIPVFWSNEKPNTNYQVVIKVSSIDRINGVADMINVLNTCDVVILSISSQKTEAGDCITRFKLQVKDLDNLNHAIVNLNKMSDIYSVERIFK